MTSGLNEVDVVAPDVGAVGIGCKFDTVAEDGSRSLTLASNRRNVERTGQGSTAIEVKDVAVIHVVHDNSNMHRITDAETPCGCELDVHLVSYGGIGRKPSSSVEADWEFHARRGVDVVQWQKPSDSENDCEENKDEDSNSLLSSQASFTLKYSPSTALTASGTVSSFRAFLSCSRNSTRNRSLITYSWRQKVVGPGPLIIEGKL